MLVSLAQFVSFPQTEAKKPTEPQQGEKPNEKVQHRNLSVKGVQFAFKAESGVSKVADSHSDEGESCSHPPESNVRVTRRMGICFVIEEEDRHCGMALAELRSKLILCHTLEKFGLF